MSGPASEPRVIRKLRQAADMIRIEDITRFQADEVAGLLDVAGDEQRTSGEQRPWARIGGGFGGHRPCLAVIDADAAVDDLRRRADHLEQEGARAGRNGGPRARSLRALAVRIEQESARSR